VQFDIIKVMNIIFFIRCTYNVSMIFTLKIIIMLKYKAIIYFLKFERSIRLNG